MNEIINKIRKQTTPSQKIQSKKKKIANLIINLVKEQIKDNENIVGVEIGGSYAKGTWLAQKADIDVFVKFKDTVSQKKFREIGESVGFNSLKKYRPYIRYSEHPYVEAFIQGTKVNVVPCYSVKKGEWKSSADRSQFHTRFMLNSLDKNKQKDVRVLKQFLKSNNIYGAEISKQGFSGYVSEVLIWNLGSFEKVIEKFTKIQQGVIIGKTEKVFDTTITIMDPIDNNRNLAAAISDENITKLILLSRAFLKKPTIDFFKVRKPNISKDALKQIIILDFAYSKRSPDTIWGQIKRASSSLRTQFNVSGFNVVRSSAISNEKENHAQLIFLIESHNIAKKQIKEGPEVFKERDLASFITKNLPRSDLMWIDKTRKVFSLEKREFDNAEKFLKNLLTKKLNRSGIPKGLRDDIKKGFTVTTGDKRLRKSIKEELLEFVSIDEKIFSPYS